MSSDKRPLRAVFPNFCPPCERRRSRQSVWGPDVIAVCGGQAAWRHPPRLAVPSSRPGRGQRRRAGIRCDRDRMSCPPPVLRKSLAEPRGLARACRARGRGSPGHRRRLAPALQEAARGSQPWRGLRAPGPRRAVAFPDAAGEGVAPTRSRRIPAASREAPGSPARRPEGGRHRAIVQAT